MDLTRTVPLCLLFVLGVTAQESERWDPAEARTGWAEGERARLEVALWSQGRHAMARGLERKVSRQLEGTVLVRVGAVDEEGRVLRADLTLERLREKEADHPGPLQAKLAREGEGPLLLVLESTPDGLGLRARPLLEEVARWMDGSVARALGRPWVAGEPHPFRTREELAPLARAFVPGVDPTGQTRDAEDGVSLRPTLTPEAVKLAGKGPLPFATLPGAVDCKLEPGGRSELELEAEWPRGRGPSQGRVKAVHRFEGKGKNRLPDGREVDLEAVHEHRLEVAVTLLD